jgi:23S rRNA (pseudouridine1915-N3)-methyltransferase
VQYRFIWVGRAAQDPLMDACDKYLARLGYYVNTQLVKVRQSDPKGEARQILSQLKPNDVVIALDEKGTQHTTMQVVARLERLRASAVRDVAFVIGGADGLDTAVKARAQQMWGLSQLTLPHRLAQVLLCEQLYRAHSIMRGEQYHRV